MNKNLLFALASLFVAGCGVGLVDPEGGQPKSDFASDGDAITNGTSDSGHASVGKLYESGQGICTATLIGSKTVLCAAHCITKSASAYSFVVGGQSYAAASVTVHPGWDGNANQGEGINDLSVIILKTAPSVTPSPIADSAPYVGETLTLVGFGVTNENLNNYGTKRIAHNVISDIGSTVFYWDPSQGSYQGQSTCYGDSGGPAFATLNGVETQVGITSGGAEPCATGYSWDTNVYLFADWIRQVANGDVVTAGGSTCTPSCSGRACGSDGCGGTCGTCGSGTSCSATYQCVSSGGSTSSGPVTESVSDSVAKGASKYYGPFTVAAGTKFDVKMTGTGDADLYVRFGSKPTSSTYDCRPYLDGSNETCSLTVPSGKTTAYIMVKGYAAATYSLAITYSKTAGGTSSGGTTSSGTAQTAQTDDSVASGATNNYNPITVLAGTTFKVVMSGSGDPDLYVRFGAAPTMSTYACRPYLNGADETCSVTVPAGQSQAFIMVYGYASSTYHLDVSYTAP